MVEAKFHEEGETVVFEHFRRGGSVADVLTITLHDVFVFSKTQANKTKKRKQIIQYSGYKVCS